MLAELIGRQVLTRKHGPCPLCGGKDRYRYDNKNGNGDYYCSVCGAGDGFDLICGVMKIDFAAAAALVDKVVGNVEAQPFKQEIDVEARRRRLNEVWKKADAPHVRDRYLAGRGLDIGVLYQLELLDDVRGTGKLLDVETNDIGDGIVSLVRQIDERAISMHRIYTPAGKPETWQNGGAVKKIMPPLETIVGASIRLGDVANAEAIVVGEGLETTLAACQLYKLPGMASISANNLEELEVHGRVKRVIICADNDYSFTGQAAAFKLAYKLRNQKHKDVTVVMPSWPGCDVLNVVRNAAGTDADSILRSGELLRWESSNEHQ